MSLSLRSILLKRLEGFYPWPDSSSLKPLNKWMQPVAASARRAKKVLPSAGFWKQMWVAFGMQIFVVILPSISPHWSMSKNNENDTKIQWFLATSKPIVSVPILRHVQAFRFHISSLCFVTYCWWKKSGIHQLRLGVYPIIYQVFIHPTWCRISSIKSMALVIHTFQWFHLYLRSAGVEYVSSST